ncbi:alpha/beta fold hydrolase [Dermacoccaceae bacterium W4C1]
MTQDSSITETDSLVQLGTGPLLAVAHGAGGGVAANFTDLSGILSRSLVGIDYPGSGSRPSTGQELQLDDLADELVDSLVAAGHDRFPILGLSLGCSVAVRAAVRHPQHVTGLVLTVGFAHQDAQIASFSLAYSRLVRAQRWADLAELLILSSGPRALAGLSPTDRDDLAQELATGQAAAGAGLAPQMDLAHSVDIRDSLPQITVPTLVVVADQDRIVLPSSTAALGAGIPGAQTITLTGAGHIFDAKATAEWAQSITTFVEDHHL